MVEILIAATADDVDETTGEVTERPAVSLPELRRQIEAVVPWHELAEAVADILELHAPGLPLRVGRSV